MSRTILKKKKIFDLLLWIYSVDISKTYKDIEKDLILVRLIFVTYLRISKKTQPTLHMSIL